MKQLIEFPLEDGTIILVEAETAVGGCVCWRHCSG